VLIEFVDVPKSHHHNFNVPLENVILETLPTILYALISKIVLEVYIFNDVLSKYGVSQQYVTPVE
jgi:hypothetical protein